MKSNRNSGGSINTHISHKDNFPYHEARLNFLLEYDRANPITSLKANQEWINFYVQMKDKFKYNFYASVGKMVNTVQANLTNNDRVEKDISDKKCVNDEILSNRNLHFDQLNVMPDSEIRYLSQISSTYAEERHSSLVS